MGVFCHLPVFYTYLIKVLGLAYTVKKNENDRFENLVFGNVKCTGCDNTLETRLVRDPKTGVIPFCYYNIEYISRCIHYLPELQTKLISEGYLINSEYSKLLPVMHSHFIAKYFAGNNAVTKKAEYIGYIFIANGNAAIRISNKPVIIYGELWNSQVLRKMSNESKSIFDQHDRTVSMCFTKYLNGIAEPEDMQVCESVLHYYGIPFKFAYDNFLHGRFSLEYCLSECRRLTRIMVKDLYHYVTGSSPELMHEMFKHNEPTSEQYQAIEKTIYKSNVLNNYKVACDERIDLGFTPSIVENHDAACNKCVPVHDEKVSSNDRCVAPDYDRLTVAYDKKRIGSPLGEIPQVSSSGIRNYVHIECFVEDYPPLYRRSRFNDVFKVDTAVFLTNMIAWILNMRWINQEDRSLHSAMQFCDDYLRSILTYGGKYLTSAFSIGTNTKVMYKSFIGHINTHQMSKFSNVAQSNITCCIKQLNNMNPKTNSKDLFKAMSNILFTCARRHAAMTDDEVDKMLSKSGLGDDHDMSILARMILNQVKAIEDMNGSCSLCNVQCLKLFANVNLMINKDNFLHRFPEVMNAVPSIGNGYILVNIVKAIEVASLRLSKGYITNLNDIKVNLQSEDAIAYCDASLFSCRIYDVLLKSLWKEQMGLELVLMVCDDKTRKLVLCHNGKYDIYGTMLNMTGVMAHIYKECIKFNIRYVNIMSCVKVGTEVLYLREPFKMPKSEVFKVTGPVNGKFTLGTIFNDLLMKKHSSGYIPEIRPVVLSNGELLHPNGPVFVNAFKEYSDILSRACKNLKLKVHFEINKQGNSGLFVSKSKCRKSPFNNPETASALMNALHKNEITIDGISKNVMSFLTSFILNEISTQELYKDKSISVLWEMRYSNVVILLNSSVKPDYPLIHDDEDEDNSKFMPILWNC